MDGRAGCGSSNEASRLLANWHLLSLAFSANFACFTTTSTYATTLLEARVGYAGSGALYVCTCLSSLFVGVPVLSALGQRRTLALAMALIGLYVGLFALAAALPKGSEGQWLAFVPGSCAGGIAAGMLWTAVGGYLSRSADLLGEVAEGGRQSATAKQSAIFAVYCLLLEVLVKSGSSVAIHWRVPPWEIFAACFVLSCAAAGGALFVQDLPAAPKQAARPLLAPLLLWSDPVLWYLAPLNFAFGFTAAFMNGYVNVAYTRPEWGEEYVGWLSAATALVAALCAHLFGCTACRMGSKGPLLVVGSMCFLGVPGFIVSVDMEQHRYFLLLPYILMGVGRAVYESTNRGVFADFFAGARAESAFANQMMQTTLSFAFCFFFSATLSMRSLAVIILVMGGLVCPGYLSANVARGRSLAAKTAEEEEADGEEAASFVPKK